MTRLVEVGHHSRSDLLLVVTEGFELGLEPASLAVLALTIQLCQSGAIERDSQLAGECLKKDEIRGLEHQSVLGASQKDCSQ